MVAAAVAYAEPMPRVVLMCGPAGSGKTTYTRGLERDGFIRLSIDEVAWSRGHRSQPLDETIAAQIETELRSRLAGLVRAGRDVVLDFSFWSRSSRTEYRTLLATLGVQAETVYLATPRDVALARVAARAWRHADDVALDAQRAAAYFDHFEVPTEAEGPLTVITG